MLFASYEREPLLHFKKNRFLPNPQKRFRRCLKASKGVRSLKKRIEKIYETFKGSYRVSRLRTFSYETFF
jgi:hypothetical protein